MDREEREFYEMLLRELENLRRLAATGEEGTNLQEAMADAADRADSIAKEARFLQLDSVADNAERLARQARETDSHDRLGSFLETLFSFHDQLPPEAVSLLRGAARRAGTAESGPEGTSDRKTRQTTEVLATDAAALPRDGFEKRSAMPVELVFNTPPQELFELGVLERKLVIDAIDQGEHVFSLSALARPGEEDELEKLLHLLEEALHVLRALTPESGGRPGRIDLLVASSQPQEGVTQLLSDTPLQEARIQEIRPERLSLSVDRPELRVRRGLLASLQNVEFHLPSDEYERYTLLQQLMEGELSSLADQQLPAEVAERVGRVKRLAEATASDLRYRSRWRALELAYRVALWAEAEGLLDAPLRLSVEGGDQEELESPVAQLAERALRNVFAILLDVTGLGRSADGARPRDTSTSGEFVFEVHGDPYRLTLWLTPVSPALVSPDALQARLSDSEARYVVEDLLSGTIRVGERRGSEGVSITTLRGGRTMTVLIGASSEGEVAFPAALVVESQPLFSRLVAQSADGRVFMRFRGSNVPLYDASGAPLAPDLVPREGEGVVMRIGTRRIAVILERLISEETVILQSDTPETVFVETLQRRLPFFLPLELF